MSLNVENFVTLKLTQTNYLPWIEQVLGLVKIQDLVDHLTNETPVPQKFIASNSTTTEPQLTKEFATWQKYDHLLWGWIIDTLSEEVLGFFIGIDTTQTVWKILKEACAQDSQEREFTLRQQLIST